MFRTIKHIARRMCIALKWDLTKNLHYDRYTSYILRKSLKDGNHAIDVGAHKGEMMDEMFKYVGSGSVTAFEPIPYYFEELKSKFSEVKNAIVHPYALAEHRGVSMFHFVKNAPAYSGLKRRTYALKNPDIEEIQVELRKLDETLPEHLPISLIKIDVEGAELGVIKGAEQTIRRHKPIIIFECGKGASDFYGTTPQMIFQLFNEWGMQISLLPHFFNDEPPLTQIQFESHFEKGDEYYFVAGPIVKNAY